MPMTLPVGGTVNISQGVELESQPTLTWLVDPSRTSIVGTSEGADVMKQAVEIILSVQRFKWQIYSGNFGMDYRGLIGGNPGVVASNLLRRLRDAFSVDDRILSVDNFAYTVDGDSLTASFTVRTVYRDIQETAEVIL